MGHHLVIVAYLDYDAGSRNLGIESAIHVSLGSTRCHPTILRLCHVSHQPADER